MPPPDLPAATRPQSAVRLVRKILKEQCTDRALEADVEMGVLTFSKRHETHTEKCQSFEESGRVFLITAESIERFRQNDIELTIERTAHQRLKSWSQQGRSVGRRSAACVGRRGFIRDVIEIREIGKR